MEVFRRAVRRPFFVRGLYTQVESLELSELTQLARDSPREQTLWRRMGRRAQVLWANEGCSVEESLEFMESAASKGYTDAELMYNFGAMAPQFNAEQASRALKVHADVFFANPNAFRELEVALDGGSPDAVLRGVWSLCSLAHRGQYSNPPLDLLKDLPLDELSSHDIVRFVDAHYLAKHSEPTQLRDAVKRLNLDEVSAGDLAQIAKSFAKLRVNADTFFHDMTEKLQEPGKLAAFSGSQIVDLAYAFAKFGQQGTSTGMLFDIFATEARKKLHTLTIAELSQFLSSFARVQVAPKIVLARAQSRLKAGSEWWIDSTFEDIVNLTMAFGKFQTHDAKLAESLSSALTYHFTEGPKDPSTFTISDVINIVHAFAKVHLRPSAELLAIVTRELEARIDEIELPDLIKYLHAAGKVQLTGELSTLLVSRLDKEAVSSLSLFDALKVHLALQRLDGVESTALEAHLAEVLPYDLRTERRAWTSRRKPVEPIKKRKTARKRKWTW
eukprot:GEMP01050241.1.p1 GENE.GEMP01050241.1~~GEMP01050241.1.p1  ORF type:complete len:501 (+),score=86.86 GEMP01050241.1:104-1606(+)